MRCLSMIQVCLTCYLFVPVGMPPKPEHTQRLLPGWAIYALASSKLKFLFLNAFCFKMLKAASGKGVSAVTCLVNAVLWVRAICFKESTVSGVELNWLEQRSLITFLTEESNTIIRKFVIVCSTLTMIHHQLNCRIKVDSHLSVTCEFRIGDVRSVRRICVNGSVWNTCDGVCVSDTARTAQKRRHVCLK
jgi:hypothetical protein